MAAFFRQLFARAADASNRAPAGPSCAEWRARGNAALAAGDLREAQRCYSEAVRADPEDPLARLNLGFTLLESGNTAEAAELLTQSIALHRSGDNFLHDAHFLLARAYAAQGAVERALASFQAAADARPGFAEPLEEAARMLHGLRRFQESLAWAQRLADVQPSAAAKALMAQQLFLCGRGPEALAILDEVLAQEPRNAQALSGRGQVLLNLGRADEALAAFNEVLALLGPAPDGHVHAAVALQQLGRFDEALLHLDSALQRQPDHRPALCNRVSVLLEQLRLHEATLAAREAMQVAPDEPDLHWSLAMAHLLLGELEHGWEEHEWRWRRGTKHPLPQLACAQWTGEDLTGRTILLFGEQGFGDSIQFVRYVPRVAQRAAVVLLAVPQGLESLMAGLAPNCVVLQPGQPLPPVDYQCPLLSLPRAFATTLNTIPATVPYLRANAARVAEWRARLLGLGSALKVGVVWSGNAVHANDRNRSIALASFRELSAPGCRFIGLQPEIRDTDRAALRLWPELLPLGLDLRDFTDTAALLEALDLVVTVDTSVAHLAGALGRPVWVLLPYCPDWRWMIGRDDSPWYPTARLYRQPAARQWAPVLERIRGDLAALSKALRS